MAISLPSSTTSHINSSVPVNLKSRSPFNWDKVNSEAIFAIFNHCIAKGYVGRLLAFAYTNKNNYNLVTSWVKAINLQQICILLDILDAKKLGIEIKDEPSLNKFEAIKWYQAFAPYIENNDGLTILTMSKGLTFRHLIDLAEKNKITLTIRWDQIPSELEHAPVEDTYRVIISNNIVQKIINAKLRTTRGKTYDYKESLVRRIGFDQMPTLLEQAALCIYQVIFNKKYPYGQNPLTYGSSLRSHRSSLLIGNCGSNHLDIISSVKEPELRGAGGRRKLKGLVIPTS